jgi:ATP-dependent Clp protease ATP-binding subunit ClpB
VGQTAIAEGLAQRIGAGEVPEGMKNKRVTNGTSAACCRLQIRGRSRRSIKAFIKEVIEAQGRIILFIDELHTLGRRGQREGARGRPTDQAPAGWRNCAA